MRFGLLFTTLRHVACLSFTVQELDILSPLNNSLIVEGRTLFSCLNGFWAKFKVIIQLTSSCTYTLNKHIRIDQHSQQVVGYTAIFSVLFTYNGENVPCHLIGRVDGHIRQSLKCILTPILDTDETQNSNTRRRSQLLKFYNIKMIYVQVK